jgi:hypothetical protein
VTDDDQRREPRFACQLPAILWRGKRSLSVVTENISFSGLFLSMAAPPAVRELVEIEIQLPPEDRPVRVHGMVMHAILRGRDAERVAGIGIELRALRAEARAAWERFVRHEQAQAAVNANKRGSAKERGMKQAPTVSVREEEVSEETIDTWESEEPTHVRPLAPPEKRKR